MKATEFAYWLQGYFDFGGLNTALTETQAKAVFKKAESVQIGQEGDVEAKAEAFVMNAKSILSLAAMSMASEYPSYLSGATKELRTKLNDLFVGVLVPATTKDQAVIRKAPRPAGLGWPG